MDLARRYRKEPPLNAESADQLRLLDLQAVDSADDLLAHRARTLPEHVRLNELQTRLNELQALVVAAQTEASDIEREQSKAESDVEQVRERSARDQQRLDSGAITSAKELESLQHEIGSLARRQAELEDTELEVMERFEVASQRAAELLDERASLTGEAEATTAKRDEQLAVIKAERGALGVQRTELASTIDSDLITLYAKLREQFGGVGAARLQQRRCEGCRLELTATDLVRIRDAAQDEVIRCEECRRILIRTPESGL